MASTAALLDILDVRSGATVTHDPYSALCAMFEICNALYWLDPNMVPAGWEFRPSMAGGLDYAECGPDEECTVHCGECTTPRALLEACGVVMDDPYSTPAGELAESLLIELGNELNPYALMSEV